MDKQAIQPGMVVQVAGGLFRGCIGKVSPMFTQEYVVVPLYFVNKDLPVSFLPEELLDKSN